MVSLALVLSLLAPLQPLALGAGAAPSRQQLEQDDAPRSSGDELHDAGAAVEAGDAQGAARACERVLARVAESLARSEGAPGAEVRSELFELVKLAEEVRRLDAPDAASALLERAAALYERHLPADAPDALHCRGLRSLLASDAEAAKELFEAEVRGRAASGAEDDPDLLRARASLGDALKRLGDLEGARALEEAVLAAREASLPEDHPDLSLARERLAVTRYRLGDPEGARALQEAALAAREARLPEGHPYLTDARIALAAFLYRLGDLEGTRALEEAVLAAREARLPDGHPDLLRARNNLAVTLSQLGDLEGARALQAAVLAAYEASLPEDHPDLLTARQNLARTLYRLGDLEGTRALEEAVLAACEASLPEGDPDLLTARKNLARTLYRLGDLEGTRALEEAVLAAYEASLPEGAPDLTAARADLAVTLRGLGDLEGARALQEAVLAARAASLPEDHTDVLKARGDLASILRGLGDVERARELHEAVLAAFASRLPEERPEVLWARGNLASTLYALGDLEGARALEEAVLEVREATLPEGHPQLLTARANLAVTLGRLGDRDGARALEEAVLAAREASLPEGHPELLTARANLAVTLSLLGDLEGARALQEAVLAACEASLPEGHPDLLRARAGLAVTLSGLGDDEGARALEEAVLAAREATLPEGHPSLSIARENLSVTLSRLGEHERARALAEGVLATYVARLPEGHPDVQRAHGQLARILLRLGDVEAARELLPGLARGLLARLAELVTVSPREASAVARREISRGLPIALILSEAGDGGREASTTTSFELVETLRHVSQQTTTWGVEADADADVAAWRDEAARLRAELNDLVTSEGGDDEARLADEVRRVSLARDRVERRIRERLAEDGVFTDSIGAGAVAAALEPGTAAVGFLRYDRDVDPLTERTDPVLLAHVVRPGERPARLQLGPADELEELVLAWRASLAAPVLRGVAIESAGDEDAGEELRRRVLDPVLAAAGDVHTLHVCLDDFLFLAPLEALPLDDGCVGDRVRLVSEVSFARLIAPRPPANAEPMLLALGGASFNARGASSLARVPGAATPPADRGERSRPAMRFGALLQTRLEVETIGALFEARFDAEPLLLTAKEASKGALYEDVVGARFVHLATHGWFAPESVASQADERGGDASTQHVDAREAVTGFAPMTLCGLALAGANEGPDSMGRVPGILTAEELAGLDLSQCELAVLSACETNVGVRRAGQGIQSLQAALHAAGARTSVTSLWKVDDALTRRLMELFYSYLWLEELGKADALWSAKRDLRDEGAAPRDWAGWILTGDPD